MTGAPRLAVGGVVVALAALAWPSFTAASGLGLPCALRTVTGIPCPACGLTTASVALVRGRFSEAVDANPFVLLLAALAVAAAVLVALRARGHLLAMSQWSDRRRSLVLGLATVGAVFSEGWQLHRFDLV